MSIIDPSVNRFVRRDGLQRLRYSVQLREPPPFHKTISVIIINVPARAWQSESRIKDTLQQLVLQYIKRKYGERQIAVVVNGRIDDEI